MSESDRLKSELAKLPIADRADIASFLLESLDREEDQSEAALDEELRRRLAEIESGQAVGKPAEEVLARLGARFQ